MDTSLGGKFRYFLFIFETLPKFSQIRNYIEYDKTISSFDPIFIQIIEDIMTSSDLSSMSWWQIKSYLASP